MNRSLAYLAGLAILATPIAANSHTTRLDYLPSPEAIHASPPEVPVTGSNIPKPAYHLSVCAAISKEYPSDTTRVRGAFTEANKLLAQANITLDATIVTGERESDPWRSPGFLAPECRDPRTKKQVLADYAIGFTRMDDEQSTKRNQGITYLNENAGGSAADIGRSVTSWIRFFNEYDAHTNGIVIAHEVGHSLGLVHRPGTTAIMNRKPYTEINTFSTQEVAIMRENLLDRHKTNNTYARRFYNVTRLSK